MQSAQTILSVEKSIVELRGRLAEYRFFRRLSLIWLFGVNSLTILGVIAGNTLVDFSKPGQGREDLNGFAGFGLLVSLISSLVAWNQCRVELQKMEIEISKLELTKNSLRATENSDQTVRSAFQTYFDSIPGYRDDYRRSAEKYRSRHNLFQLTVIVGSILTSVSATASTQQGAWKWAAVTTSAFVSISAGIISYFKFRERSLNLQQTADAIDLELQAYNLRIRRYRGTTPDEAAAEFAEEVERIREEQRKKELQLEQPPEASPGQRQQN